jgi:hypothetical protein
MIEDSQQLRELLQLSRDERLRLARWLIDSAIQQRRTRADGQPPPYVYPSVPCPAATIDAWMNLLPEGYEGDALADTEALYDET